MYSNGTADVEYLLEHTRTSRTCNTTVQFTTSIVFNTMIVALMGVNPLMAKVL